jgi:hypothetical protein
MLLSVFPKKHKHLRGVFVFSAFIRLTHLLDHRMLSPSGYPDESPGWRRRNNSDASSDAYFAANLLQF